MLIKDYVYYVTGGSSGLGLATVEELHRLGAYVAVLDMNQEAGETLVNRLGKKALFAQCDVRSEDDVEAAIVKVDKEWGDKQKVGGVVHCGGIGMAGKTINNDGSPFDLETFRQTIDINLTGSFNIGRLIAARIIKTSPPPKRDDANAEDRGVIIFTSSVSFEEGQMGQAAYASSKAGVVGLVLPMARDLARYGIRVSAIAPSLFSTAMGANTSPKTRDNLLKSTLFPPRFGESREFAQLAVTIIENQMLNGSVIRLDGGSRMNKM